MYHVPLDCRSVCACAHTLKKKKKKKKRTNRYILQLLLYCVLVIKILLYIYFKLYNWLVWSECIWTCNAIAARVSITTGFSKTALERLPRHWQKCQEISVLFTYFSIYWPSLMKFHRSVFEISCPQNPKMNESKFHLELWYVSVYSNHCVIGQLSTLQKFPVLPSFTKQWWWFDSSCYSVIYRIGNVECIIIQMQRN